LTIFLRRKPQIRPAVIAPILGTGVATIISLASKKVRALERGGNGQAKRLLTK
jgi:hypothetical protein